MALVMAMLTFAGCGKEKAAEELVFGTNAEFPPFEFVASKGVIGEFDGIDMAIADLIAKDNGMTAAISNMEFDSLLIALQNGQVDAVIAGTRFWPQSSSDNSGDGPDRRQYICPW